MLEEGRMDDFVFLSSLFLQECKEKHRKSHLTESVVGRISRLLLNKTFQPALHHKHILCITRITKASCLQKQWKDERLNCDGFTKQP